MERVERRKEDRGMERRRAYKPGDAAREQAFGAGAASGTTVPSGGAGGAEIPAGAGAEAGSRGTAGTGGAGYTNPGGSDGVSSAKHDADPETPGHDTDFASSPVGKPESSSGSRRTRKKNQGHLAGHAEEDVPNDAWPFAQEIKKP
jgi:hypothetical protein